MLWSEQVALADALFAAVVVILATWEEAHPAGENYGMSTEPCICPISEGLVEVVVHVSEDG